MFFQEDRLIAVPVNTKEAWISVYRGEDEASYGRVVR
jgi:hypothetical protein